MEAQTMTGTPVGEYYLRGVMETASGFRINEDRTFQFFFSQGALDRSGEGNWEMKQDMLVLNSRQKPAHDFALVNSSQKEKDGVRIQITDSNDLVIRYVQATIKGGGKTQQAVTDEQGMILFAAQPVESIELLFAFCPEKVSVFTIAPGDHDSFVFRFEPWMMEFFFKDFKLKLTEEGLSGSGLVLEGNFIYKKSKGNN
jgi:hypothetical protein